MRNYFSVFPNPFADEIVIDNYSENEIQIELYSADGRRLQQTESSRNKKVKLTTNSISAGFYHLKITEKESGRSAYFKLIRGK